MIYRFGHSRKELIDIAGKGLLSEVEIPESLKKYSILEEHLSTIEENKLEKIIDDINNYFTKDEFYFVFKQIIFFSIIRPLKHDILAQLYSFFATKYSSQLPSVQYIVFKNYLFARKLYDYGVIDLSSVPYSKRRKLNNMLTLNTPSQKISTGLLTSRRISEIPDNTWAIFFDVFNKEITPEQQRRIHFFTTGYEENSIQEVIKYDNISAFQKLVAEDDFEWNGDLRVCEQDILDKEKNFMLNIIQFAAYYGAVNCFKFAVVNKQQPSSNTETMAIIGGNNEIIHILEQNNIEFNEQFLNSLQYFHFDIADWLLTTKISEYNIEVSQIIQLQSIKALYFIYKIKPDELYINYLTPVVQNDNDHLYYAIEEIKTHQKYVIATKSETIDRKLNYACKNNNLPLVLELTKSGSLTLSTVDNDLYDSTPLDYACRNGNIDMARYLIDKGADINFGRRYSSLYHAINSGNIDLIKFLLEKGAKYPQSPMEPMLISAVKSGDLQIVQLIYEKEPNVNVICNHGRTPEYYAVTNGFLDILIFLINNGAKLLSCRGDSLLFCNIPNNFYEIVKLLLEFGCEKTDMDVSRLYKRAINVADSRLFEYLISKNYPIPESEIVHSFRYKNDEIFQKLLPSINPKKSDYTFALVSCIRTYDIEHVKQLVEKGINVNGIIQDRDERIRDRHGMIRELGGRMCQPLIAAINKGDMNLIKYLLDKGAHVEPEQETSNTDDMPLVAASRQSLEIFKFIYSKTQHPEKYINFVICNSEENGQIKLDIIDYLIQKGMKVSTEFVSSFSNNSPLNYAIRHNMPDYVEKLLEIGFDPNFPCKRKDSFPLQVACRGSGIDIKIIQILINHKADVNKVSEYRPKRTPLCICFRRSNDAAAKLLLQNGADPNILSSRKRWTCLHQAVSSRSSIEMIQLLLDRGVSVNVEDYKKRTPLFYVTSTQTAQFLIEHGADVNHKDQDGNTPLHQIVQTRRSLDIVKYLVQHGADPHAHNYGKTAYDYARNDAIKDILKQKTQ